MLRLSPAHEAEREPACTRCLQQRRPKVSGELNVMSNGSARLVTGNKTSRCACAPKKCCKGLRLHSRQGELPRSSVLQTVNSRPSSRLPIATEIQSHSAGAACLETTTRDGAAADPSSRKAQPCSRFVSRAVMGPPDLSGKRGAARTILRSPLAPQAATGRPKDPDSLAGYLQNAKTAFKALSHCMGTCYMCFSAEVWPEANAAESARLEQCLRGANAFEQNDECELLF